MVVEIETIQDIQSPENIRLLREKMETDSYILVSVNEFTDPTPTPTPPTPPSNIYHIGETTKLAQQYQTTLNSLFGKMVAYEAEGGGRLFQDIVPSLSQTNCQTSLSSLTELEIHTEQAFSELRPDYISLACLKGNPEAKTYVLFLDTLLQHLTEKQINLLQQPLWMTNVDESFLESSARNTNNNNNIINNIDTMGNNYNIIMENQLLSQPRGPLSILQKDKTEMVFDQNLMYGITLETDTLIDIIIDIYYQYRQTFILKPGDIFILNNRRAVHGRSSFQPRFDRQDRFLIRSFIMNELNYKSTEWARDKETNQMVLAKYS